MQLILKLPLKQNPLKITQRFGANGLCYNPKTNGIHLKPDVGCKDWGQDWVSLYDEHCGLKGHNGLDIACGMGELVYSAHDGEITEIETEINRGYGLAITSEYKYKIEGGNYRIKTRYWHLLGWCVKMGQKVKAGEVIGVGDSTGISGGSHLHFELKALSADGTNAFQDNFYFGAINPEPFLEEQKLQLTKELKYGCYDPEVIILKKILANKGYTTNLNYTDYFGCETLKLVKRFQRDNGICVLCLNNKVGWNTLKLLNQ